jgi:hypothetical protein
MRKEWPVLYHTNVNAMLTDEALIEDTQKSLAHYQEL